ncbi:uncharacterized protein LOC126653573 [Mercurialis annua]|uniref:uncharacterized protein LOC126653573 n=1 Tax=Mercurialis annua TaxID=3986 RepID=UPI0021610313|nr:uncharacterized protein LOC126653573 [Mercurialis annua]
MIPVRYVTGGRKRIVHIFSSCSLAIDYWELAGLKIGNETGMQVQAWSSCWLHSLGRNEVELASLICWRLWLNRNNVVWGKSGSSAAEVVGSSSHQLHVWKMARFGFGNSDENAVEALDGQTEWQCAAAGYFKVNVDAAIFSEEGKAAVGCVLRNEKGEVIQARQVGFAGVFDPRIVETMGIREALSWLRVGGI